MLQAQAGWTRRRQLKLKLAGVGVYSAWQCFGGLASPGCSGRLEGQRVCACDCVRAGSIGVVCVLYELSQGKTESWGFGDRRSTLHFD